MNGKVWIALLLAVFCTLCSATTAATAPAARFTNSIGIEFVLIQAGAFTMGSPQNAEERNEMPPHKVSISKSFYLGKYEVTQEQWVAVMGSNPSRLKEPNHPVDSVSWHDVQEFIKRLNAKEKHNRYRLPTEAEWEYAARAGTTTAYFFGDDSSALSRYAWYFGSSDGTSHPVGQKPPNAWGLYDVHGNVFEWTQDWFSGKYYAESPETDPQGPSSGAGRVARGGSWSYNAESARSAYREFLVPDARGGDVGFRLALSLE
jgi:formylglycine-generating enzyme required for sulfatase activity